MSSDSKPDSLDDESKSAFERIIKALETINSVNLAEVKYLSLTKEVQNTGKSDDCPVYNLPIKGHKESWAYMDNKKNRRRKFVIAALTRGQDKRYIVEFEQRWSGECSTLVIWNYDKEVPSADIIKAIDGCIKNNACYVKDRSHLDIPGRNSDIPGRRMST
jgi:hypothetical protein